MAKKRPLLVTALAAAVATNLVLFLLIPLLSQIDGNADEETMRSAFTFNNLRQAPPPPPPEEQHKQPPPPKELPKTPPALPTRSQQPPPKAPPMQMPQPQFEAAVSDMKLGGMAFNPVSAPQSEFDISQVDTMPQVISRREPVYPYKARQQKVSGVVMVKFLVATDGSVHQASVVQANPPGVFDEAALQAVSSWRFKPGMLDQSAVATWITVPIRFAIN